MLAAGIAATAVALPSPAMAKAPHACARATQAQDGTYGPVLCANGAPNSRARALLAKQAPQVMSLKRTATDAAILKAACADVTTANATLPMIGDAYAYQYARFDWKGKHRTPVGLSLQVGKTCDGQQSS